MFHTETRAHVPRVSRGTRGAPRGRQTPTEPPNLHAHPAASSVFYAPTVLLAAACGLYMKQGST